MKDPTVSPVTHDDDDHPLAWLLSPPRGNGVIIFWPDHSLHFSEDQETALRFLALMEGVRADELHLTERGGPPTSGDNASTTSDSAPTERRQPS